MYHSSDESKSEDSFKAGASKNINFLKTQEKYLSEQLEKNRSQIEVEEQKAALGANADREVKPNLRFKNFNNVFSGLTKSKNVATLYPIISCIITYNSKSVVTVTKHDDREYFVKQYSLESYKLTFEE